MKRILQFSAACALSLFLCGNLCAKDDARATEIIKGIRELYSLIEEEAQESKSFSYQPEDDPTKGEMTIYTLNGDLAKIEVSFGGEHGATNEYFYYLDGKLVFAYKTYDSWRFTGKQDAKGNSETLDSFSEYRVYFNGDKIIRALEKSVESTTAKNMSKLIKKEKNEECTKQDLLLFLQEEGLQVAKIKTQSAWKKYMEREGD